MTPPEPLEGESEAWGASDSRGRVDVESRQVYEGVKRQLDLVGASCLVLLTWPLLLIAALAIRVSTPGPVLFRHSRVGRHGEMFTMYKFRTMWWDENAAGGDYLPAGSAPLVEANYRKPTHDSAVTVVGMFLRRWSIDELPNLFNVLLGQMSLVGPRPTRWAPEAYGPARQEILSVRPGITGLWQVTGRGDLTFAERVTLDLEYVRRRSLAFDLWILIRTVSAVLSRRGAF